MKTISFCLLFFCFAGAHVFAQNRGQTNKTTRQQRQDSLGFERFKAAYPAAMQLKRLAHFTEDGSVLVKGYSTCLEILHNHASDSVEHNFRPGMPDTSTNMPYSALKLTERRLSLRLLAYLPLLPSSEASNPLRIERSDAQPPSNRINKLRPAKLSIRFSLNGKLLGDWKPVSGFSSVLYTIRQKLEKTDIGIETFTYGYSVADTVLQPADQFLVELKNDENNWIVDRYNFTCVPVAPYLSAFTHDSVRSRNVTDFLATELAKKEDYSHRIDRFYFGWSGGLAMQNDEYFPSSRLALWFRRPALNYPDSTLQYKLLPTAVSDTGWKTSGHLVFVDRLPAGRSYELLVRYKDNPQATASYRFSVAPLWYQKKGALWLLSGLGCLLFLLLVFLLYRHKAKRSAEDRQKLLLELKAIRSQLNPHFLFNSLGSIQSLINTGELQKANLFLSEFSGLLRRSLKAGDNLYQPIRLEVEWLQTYLRLEQLRFGFSYRINNQVKDETVELPGFLLQPLVENAVKHGVSALSEKGEIELNLRAENKNLVIEVLDNGNNWRSDFKKGYGLQLTDERIVALNKMLKGRSVRLAVFREAAQTVSRITFLNWMAA